MKKSDGGRKVSPTRNKSWRPGQKGQGGEGMSKGYGGSAGSGTGPSGPDSDQPRDAEKPVKKPSAKHEHSDDEASDCLPSRETITKVLR